jgi:hypothetical protein
MVESEMRPLHVMVSIAALPAIASQKPLELTLWPQERLGKNP